MATNDKSEKSQRTVLITGASGGIGRASVEVFTQKGWRVIGVDRAAYSSDFPHTGLFIQTDISSPTDIKSVFEKVNPFTHSLDSLVNNAAVQVVKPLLETTLEEWDSLMSINLRAVFLCIKEAHPLLKKGSGSIVNVSSVHAIATSKEIAPYAASKGGLLSLTRALAIEFASDNIRVNALLPGAVDTQMLHNGLYRGHLPGKKTEDKLAELAKKTVLGRVGTPEEIARAIYFLADNSQSSFMTGQPLVVDGGATVRLSTE